MIQRFLVFLTLLWSTSVFAAENSAHPDPSKLHVYLVTVDVGNKVWDNFGHSALRIIDEVGNTDTIYNWGVFEVSGGPLAFAYDFFINEVRYRLATQSPDREIANYRAQARSVWQDEILLTSAQKQRLLARLQWNRAPENIYYDYHYFFDNCTTRIRDYLNEVLDGKLSREISGGSGRSFREEVRSHYASLQPISFSLDVLMNSNIDREMSEWETLFLPLELRSHLAAIDSDARVGQQVLPLLGNSETLLSFDAPGQQSDFYRVATLVLWGCVIYFVLMLKRVRQSFSVSHAKLGFRMPGLNLRLFGFLSVVLLGASGIFGGIMLISWFISGHADLYHNLNLLLFWPTDILGALVAFYWVVSAKPLLLDHNSKPFFVYYLFLKLLAALAYCVIMWFGLSAQNGFSIATYLVPGLFVLILIGWIVGFDSRRRFDAIW